ncbi:MAG: hypothetical protein NTU76_01520, partial [Candidatus Taylorbacteria bacterium]|nr:hypothetical protein [Candidatus Taylorbacteria bacterium]
MYKGNFNGPRSSSSGTARFGNRSHGSGGFRGGRSGGFRGGRGGGGNRGKTETINFARFINKVQMVEEVEVFKPEHNFQDFKISDLLKDSIRDKGYKLPTPIQDRTIPQILMGSDIVGVANTGTGKT